MAIGMVLLATLLGVTASSAGTGEKKLIEFGWDEPGTTFMRQHIDETEMAPFDGCVFHVHYGEPDGRQMFSPTNRLRL
jgi:hypothetical protein